MWILLLLAISKISLCSDQPIDSFGILTVTYARQGDYSTLQKYLKRYTQTDCYVQFLSQINLIWNNEQAPQETNILKRKQFWKIPVYFYRTTFNSMDHRYRLPKQSKAQLLYSLDDDIIVDCATFKTTLSEYNRVGRGKIGRMVTNQVRGYKFSPSEVISEFYYQGHANAAYFTIAEPGAAFIPRHYLDLYYLKLDELISIRKFVLDVKNCDDIFFYAFLQHFYPELPAVYIKGQKDYLNTDPPIGQSKVKNVYIIRSNCISDISSVLGYNPLRYYSKDSSKYEKNWKYTNIQGILSLKIAGLSGVASDSGKEKEYIQKAMTLTKKQQKLQTKQQVPVNQIKQTLKAPIEHQNYNSKHKSQSETNQIQQQQQTQSITSTNNHSSPSFPTQQIYLQLSFNQKITALLLLILFLIYLIYKLCSINKSKKKGYTIKVNQQDQTNLTVSSIVLPDY